MTDTLSAPQETTPLQAQAVPDVSPVEAVGAVEAPGADADARTENRPPRPAGRAGGRSRRPGRSERPAAGPARQEGGAGHAPRAPRAIPPMLEQLAGLYPALFGAVFLPLKRGIFQDLVAAHPELESEALKTALAFHTRSTRYLQSVAAGMQRHDLQGQPVEDMAPEHVHHALLEVFRRRQGRGGEDLQAQLRSRIVQAFEASGLSAEAYGALVRSRDEAVNAVLDEAMAEAGARAAKDEALLRAFEASGQAVEAFADMYGLDPRAASLTLERARCRRPAPAPAA